jgi:hypothetical protein
MVNMLVIPTSYSCISVSLFDQNSPSYLHALYHYNITTLQHYNIIRQETSRENRSKYRGRFKDDTYV